LVFQPRPKDNYHSKGRPALLEGLLLERGKKMLESKTAFVRFHFVGGKY
jgi:hypothetical protein